jgi:hypothetical protein
VLVFIWSLLHCFGIPCIVHRTSCGAGCKRVVEVPSASSMGGAGHQIGCSGMVSRTTRTVRSAANARKSLILSCSYSREAWFKVLRRCGLQRITPSPGQTFAAWWTNSRKQVPKVQRKALDSLAILVSWRLWLERNAQVFSSVSLPALSLVGLIWDEPLWWSRAGLAVWDSLVVL